MVGSTLTLLGCGETRVPSAYAQAVLEGLKGTTFTDTDGLLLDGGAWVVRSSSISRSGPEGGPQEPTFYMHFGQAQPPRKRAFPVRTDGDAADIYERITGRPHSSLSGSMSERHQIHLRRYANLVNPPSDRAQELITLLIGKPLQNTAGMEQHDWILCDIEPQIWVAGWSGNDPGWKITAALKAQLSHLSHGFTMMSVPLESDGDVADLYQRITLARHPDLTGEMTRLYRANLLIAERERTLRRAIDSYSK